MNKIGILTFVRPCNYGAALQCYALNKVLEKLGAQPITLDYWPKYFKERYYPEPLPFKWSFSGFKKWKRAKLVRTIKNSRNRKFEQFIQDNVTLTSPTAYNIAELEEAMRATGIRKWIAGSDQVWNDTCARFDPAYFLDLKLPEGSTKYSYAASFGMSSIPEELKAEYQRRLSGYKRYSVREQSGVEMLRELQQDEAKVHCDPTLLLSAQEWSEVASPARGERYILIYHVLKPDYLIEKAMELSKKTGLKVILFTPYFNYASVAGRMVRKCGYIPAMESSPQDFISLIKNAEYVLTNSFHGTVFSAIFHKNFWSQIELVEGKLNNRSANLLEKLGISGRELTRQQPLSDTPIDWSKADAALETMKAEAKNYLQSIINDSVPVMQSMLPKYTSIYSLGSQCACAMYLNECGLRKMAGPFDWIMGVNFDKRVDIIIDNFNSFLHKSKLRKLPDFKQKMHDNYIDEGTGFIFMHDFNSSNDFDTEFEEVKAKYDRRIARFMQVLRFPHQRVLLIWLDFKNRFNDDYFLPACNKLLNSYPSKIDILIINPGDTPHPVWQQVQKHVYTCSAPVNSAENSDYMGNTAVLSDIFKQVQAGSLDQISKQAKFTISHPKTSSKIE